MGFLSGLIGTAVSALSGHWSAKQNAKISRDQWAYQQSNAHQLEVQDLRNAGLNPILSASNSQIASMPQVSDNGASGASANIISSALQASSAKELKLMDLKIEEQKLKNDAINAKANADNARTNAISAGIRGDDLSKADERYGAETANIKADTALKNSSKALQDAQSRFVDIQGRELVRLNDAQIASIFNHMDNESALTSAQISEIESKKSVNNAQIKALEAQAKDAIEHSNLTYWQKLDIITDINSASRKLQNLTDEQRYQYLSEMPGNIQNQAGFGLTLMNPFTNFGMRAGSGYVGSRKN
ncbi:VP2 [Gokushovirus WZ-2015a]|nr:VP2 [Gokushovirus WZ-2015a]